MTHLPIGKLPANLLQSLITRYAASDPRIIVGPGIGVDATVIEMGDRCLVAKTDPVTFATNEIGWYSVHVNANDVACCGAIPKWYLATLLLPETSTTTELVESLFAQISAACREVGACLCGGHTEITHGLTRPIVVGQMLGEAPLDGYVAPGGARVGDALILTKAIAIEGTAVIAREKRRELQDVLPESQWNRCADVLRSPGISIVPEARIAIDTGGVHALHDPTEGGLATGLWELAEAAGVGVLVYEESIPILAECEVLCRRYGLNPLGLIASGALLISAKREKSEDVIRQLQAAKIQATQIGEVVTREEGCRIRSRDGRIRPLPVFDRDEITKLFE